MPSRLPLTRVSCIRTVPVEIEERSVRRHRLGYMGVVRLELTGAEKEKQKDHGYLATYRTHALAVPGVASPPIQRDSSGERCLLAPWLETRLVE